MKILSQMKNDCDNSWMRNRKQLHEESTVKLRKFYSYCYFPCFPIEKNKKKRENENPKQISFVE